MEANVGLETRAGIRLAWLVAALAVLLPGVAPAAPRTPVIIAADPGDDIDDAYAIAWALRAPELDVRAIVTSFGDTRLRDRMVRRMVATLGRRDVPIGHGVATKPATVFTQQAWAEAAPAIGRGHDGIALALKAIRRAPGRVTLLALAPLTDVATMIARDPATFGRLKAVLVMGGSIRRGYGQGDDGPVNPVPSAEYNAAQDPAGLRALIASGVPVTLFPLDSTQIKFDRGRQDRLFGSGAAAGTMLAALTTEWRRNNPWKQPTPTLFDAVPVAAAIDPAACPTTPLRIAVDDRGYTREEPGPANIRVCFASDAAPILDRMVRDLAG